MILASDREHRYLAFNEAHRRGMKYTVGVDIQVGMNVLDLGCRFSRSRSSIRRSCERCEAPSRWPDAAVAKIRFALQESPCLR
jgi:hypothetical protein